jgi:hypothetical protein
MSTRWTRTIPFKVDIAGIIEIMGKSLYSRATTPVRELIQNGHDAILRRRQEDLSYKGRIDIAQDAPTLTLRFADDGIGLNESEAEHYLGTLGIGITGLLKRSSGNARGTDAGSLIGQFGIGLFSAFMLADQVMVETKKADGSPAVRWEAGAGTEITLSSCERDSPGTTVTLRLKQQFGHLATDAKLVEDAIKEYADFLPIPIHLNSGPTRVNLISAAWFDPSPDPETLSMELESFFHDAPLDVIPIRAVDSGGVHGALYVTPQRTPGFSGEALVTVTVRRMVISRSIRGLLPSWASFLRGVLELNNCSTTASREDLVRDEDFDRAKATLEAALFSHFERLAQTDAARISSVATWHRYTFAGASVENQRLRALMRKVYPFTTSRENLTFEQIIAASTADPLFEPEADHVVWFNPERRQERYLDGLFAAHHAPCVHTSRSFEQSLLSAMIGDLGRSGKNVELRAASPGSPQFGRSVLGISDIEEAPENWQKFLVDGTAKVFLATFDRSQPAMAFINERRELLKTFDELKKSGTVPSGFQRLIDKHFDEDRPGVNEVLINRSHPLVSRAMAQKTSHPLASVLRLLVFNALSAAGATPQQAGRDHVSQDLEWIADALHLRKS